MSLNKNYEITVDIINGTVKCPQMNLYTVDAEVFNLIVTLTSGGTIISNSELNDYIVALFVVRPDGSYATLSGSINGTKDSLLFDLPERFNNQPGKFTGEFLIVKGIEQAGTNTFTYTIKEPMRAGLPEATMILDSLGISTFNVNEAKETPYSEIVTCNNGLILKNGELSLDIEYIKNILKEK